MILCRVLGPVVIEVDGVACELGGPTPRRVLAALATGSGAPVEDAVLAELAWGTELDDNVKNMMRVAIHRLRGALGPAGPATIERTPSGYRLTGSAEHELAMDHEVFAARVDEGWRALAAGRAAAAVDLLTRALGWWRGDAWAELGDAVRVSALRARLIELRDTAFDELQTARLACGDLAPVVADTSRAVVETPYRERRWELLALALYRTGRQAHALAELRRVRRLLAEELGVEPGPSLRELERRMLDHDPALLAMSSMDRPVTADGSTLRTRAGGDRSVTADGSTVRTRAGGEAIIETETAAAGFAEDVPRREAAGSPPPTGRPVAAAGQSAARAANRSAGWASTSPPGVMPSAPLAPSGPPRVGPPRTRLIGRQRELAQLDSLVAAHRLVTLVGPAGVGKTRLAVEYAAVQPLSWLVRLADAHHADTIAAVVAAAIGLPSAADDPALAVRRALADSNGVLVLDNCEHLVDELPNFLLPLLDSARSIHVLVTSRRSTAIEGEYLVPLSPLPLEAIESPGTIGGERPAPVTPPSREAIDAPGTIGGEHLAPVSPLPREAIESSGTAIGGEHVAAVSSLPLEATEGSGTAVELLIDRVRMHRPHWQPDAAEFAAARAICVALDGLPLAIELAAARERVHGLGGIAAHLRDRIDILAPTPRGSLSPHASLSAAIAWSVDQLDAADRRLLLRLWPFEDGFTWEAAAAVSPGDTAVLAGLAGLVDRSVLVADTGSGFARYRMLETIRIYCRGIDPDPAATRAAHARWVRALAVEQAALLTGPRSGEAARTLSAELANIRAGITHDLAVDPESALRSAGALGYLWVTGGTIAEGRALTEAALAACPAAPARDRATALIGLSICALHGGDHEAALRHADTVLELLDPADPEHEVLLALAHSRKCNALAQIADHTALRAAHARFLAAAARPGIPDHLRVNAQLGVGLLKFRDGDEAAALATLDAAHEMAGRCGYLWGAGITDLLSAWCLLGHTASDANRIRAILRLLERAVESFRAQPNVSDLISAMFAGACALADLGDLDAAVRLHAAVGAHAHRIGVNPHRYLPLAGPAARERMDRLASLASESREPTPDWEATIELFFATARTTSATD
ncbi:AfsR/SARP family transcriptional regulator [Nocardia sp. CDC160]|uniref:AfsR/SARP family transcriptional regulator n=1 Tax=Nocardia sp. CDC160 TaxID=3112166 RepID=UPI002DBD17BA|nr:BTAD domain-containing putative transcriptional regulator [Nocardia sp. CDC160]MEC3914437.1 BTAD domain-containing putative transcriptional regulator [Nocardia sp. CDC160]